MSSSLLGTREVDTKLISLPLYAVPAFQVDTADELEVKLRVCMGRDDSIIHVGFSFGSKRPYYGLVEACTPHGRWAEHWRSNRQHQTGLATNREEKYAYMAASGGISKWFFLPYISCGCQIELSRLQHLEQSITRRFPNALNRTGVDILHALREWCERLQIWTRMHRVWPERLHNRVTMIAGWIQQSPM